MFIGFCIGAILAFFITRQVERESFAREKRKLERSIKDVELIRYQQDRDEFERFRTEATRLVNEAAERAILMTEADDRMMESQAQMRKAFNEMNDLLNEAINRVRELEEGDYAELLIKHERLLARLN